MNIDINGLPYMLVADLTVGTATTSVSFTGLTISKDDDYMLVSDVVNTGDCPYYLYANNNTTNTNYYAQRLYASSTTVGGDRQNYPMLMTLANAKGNSFAKIKLTNSGYFVYQSTVNHIYGSSASQTQIPFGTSTFTMTSITSLTVRSETANQILVGSRFQLYKCVAEKVADITVATATTSVSITGLNIDKTGEYMLVSDFVNGISGYNGLSVYINNNTTETNYYYQQLEANSTTIIGTRVNAPTFLGQINTLGIKTFGIANIKLTNNGYFIMQNQELRSYGTSGTWLINHNITSTFTATSITSLALTSLNANSIGIGSRFQLYKMK